MHDVCITLVNTNETDAVYQCLSSLYADTDTSQVSLQVIVVDNNSDEDIEPMLLEHFPDVTLIRNTKNIGFGRSHNRALAKGDARYYFVLNPDTWFEKGQRFLEHAIDFMENNPHVGIMGPKIYYPDGSLQYSCFRFPTFLQPLYSRTKLGESKKGKVIKDRFMMKDNSHTETIPVDWIMGSAMFVRRESMEEVGMFDDRYWMYAEDCDWCRNMWEKNWAVYYYPEIVLAHVHGRASAKVPGVINALVKNKYARVHVYSWIKYFIKWRNNRKYYVDNDLA